MSTAPSGPRIGAEDVAALACFGPYFTVDTHVAGSAVRLAWRPMTPLSDEPEVLRARVAAVRAALAAAAGRAAADIEWRVAASVTQLGLSARLLSPVLGLAVVSRRVLELDFAVLRWQPEIGGAFPQSIEVKEGPSASRNAHPAPTAGELARSIVRAAVEGPVPTMLRTLSQTYALSPIVAWGNVASALNGAATVLATTRPELTNRAYGLVSAALAELPFHDTAHMPGPSYRRRSCCLIYRIGTGQRADTCRDCVLAHATD